MIWHYFPIGMRFPVADFSEETRRNCWKIALSAVFASDAAKTGLYEACEAFDPISQSPVYICIVCYVGIKQARKAGETMHSLDALMTRLCLHKPLMQANDLESFGPYPILAEIDAVGTIRPNETGRAIIPTEAPAPMRRSTEFRILIAPDSMKGVCDAERLSRVLGTAAADHGLSVRRMPIADGGEGTARVLVAGTGGRYETVSCEDMNGDQVKMLVGVIPDRVAVIEAADAVGFSWKTEHTPPIGQRSGVGVGMLIRKTLDLGYKKIWIGLGGSMTVDLGLGALYALGIRFIDEEGESVVPCPENLSRILDIDRSGLDPRIAHTEITILYDVKAPLLGTDGALRVFGPQKGATPAQIEAWEAEFERLAPMLGADPSVPGSGAAGGLGFALASVGGILTPGAETIIDRIGIGFAIREADFVITGEGSFDSQSIRFEKAPVAVMERLTDAGRPGCLFVGKFGLDRESLLRDHPNLRGVVTCPAGDEPYDVSIRRAFEKAVLPVIGIDVAKPSDL